MRPSPLVPESTTPPPQVAETIRLPMPFAVTKHEKLILSVLTVLVLLGLIGLLLL